ncbi:hypothetical protein BaRGS_00023934 [Batillaria attramentaria]|uniref:Uncharacterized protein n=1 Tax=Batillaria attramentaria TaxID=370345 RepID=A0ABD0KCT0_9CAEN
MALFSPRKQPAPPLAPPNQHLSNLPFFVNTPVTLGPSYQTRSCGSSCLCQSTSTYTENRSIFSIIGGIYIPGQQDRFRGNLNYPDSWSWPHCFAIIRVDGHAWMTTRKAGGGAGTAGRGGVGFILTRTRRIQCPCFSGLYDVNAQTNAMNVCK